MAKRDTNDLLLVSLFVIGLISTFIILKIIYNAADGLRFLLPYVANPG